MHTPIPLLGRVVEIFFEIAVRFRLALVYK